MNTDAKRNGSANQMGRSGVRGAGRFTLVELLVVIAIIGILASFLMPTLRKSVDAARSLQCGNNMRTVYLGLRNYAEDNRDLILNDWNNTTAVPNTYSGYSDWIHRLIHFNYIQGGADSTVGYAGHDRNNATVCPVRGQWTYKASYGGFGLNNRGPMWNPSITWANYRISRFRRPSQKILVSDSCNLTNSTFTPVTADSMYSAAYRHMNMMNAVHVDGHLGTYHEHGGYNSYKYFDPDA